VVLVGRLLVRPVLARLLRRRDRNNPTLQAAVLLSFRVALVVVGGIVEVDDAAAGE